MVTGALPVLYSLDVERAARFWEQVGFERHFQLPDDGEPGYVALRSGSAELAITHAAWAADRYGMEISLAEAAEEPCGC